MRTATILMAAALAAVPARAQQLGGTWGTAEAEAAYYRVVDLPLPRELALEAGSMCMLPDGRLAVGTRRGEIVLVSGAFEPIPRPRLHVFAEGLDEVLGLDYRDGAFYAMQQTELTMVRDRDGDERADAFDTLSDAWGFEHYHEFAWGSPVAADGSVWVVLGLSNSYHYRARFRGWSFKVTPGGETIPIASGIRSAGGVAPNEHGVMFYTESQGPWNGSCSLKHLKPGGFMGHPISYEAYPLAPGMGPTPLEPRNQSRLVNEADRIEQLVPYAVVFPYRRMGQSISGFRVDDTGGKFGPFADQLFVADYSLSIVMRATTEQVHGVWQGACYPFREGLGTGILSLEFSPRGYLVTGGTNRGWPVRGSREHVLERLEWTGKTPFEIEHVGITPRGFRVAFTRPVDRELAARPDTYRVNTFTHVYQKFYGSPEVDQTTPAVTDAVVAEDGRAVELTLDALVRGHVHELDLAAMRAADGAPLLHRNAFYTVNEIPDPPDRLRYRGGEGPGAGKKVVLIAADQEYRSEQSLPMLAKVLARRHGFDCTVLFAQNADGQVDPTQKIRWQDKAVMHDIPGLEELGDADLLILCSRLVTLPDVQFRKITDYLDSGRPLIGIRTANHGFLPLEPYRVGDRRVDIGEDVLGGKFRKHHGNWHADSTRGAVVPEHAQHPILLGVDDVWGPSDVYRTYPEGGGLREGCTPLLMGQPLLGRSPDDGPNPNKEPLPIAWTTRWTGAAGKPARVFHVTMGSARDYQSEGLRRLTVNAAYWCVGLEDKIEADSDVSPLGAYEPLASGFNYEKLGVTPKPVAAYR